MLFPRTHPSCRRLAVDNVIKEMSVSLQLLITATEPVCHSQCIMFIAVAYLVEQQKHFKMYLS